MPFYETHVAGMCKKLIEIDCNVNIQDMPERNNSSDPSNYCPMVAYCDYSQNQGKYFQFPSDGIVTKQQPIGLTNVFSAKLIALHGDDNTFKRFKMSFRYYLHSTDSLSLDFVQTQDLLTTLRCVFNFSKLGISKLIWNFTKLKCVCVVQGFYCVYYAYS